MSLTHEQVLSARELPQAKQTSEIQNFPPAYLVGGRVYLNANGAIVVEPYAANVRGKAVIEKNQQILSDAIWKVPKIKGFWYYIYLSADGTFLIDILSPVNNSVHLTLYHPSFDHRYFAKIYLAETGLISRIIKAGALQVEEIETNAIKAQSLIISDEDVTKNDDPLPADGILLDLATPNCRMSNGLQPYERNSLTYFPNKIGEVAEPLAKWGNRGIVGFFGGTTNLLADSTDWTKYYYEAMATNPYNVYIPELGKTVTCLSFGAANESVTKAVSFGGIPITNKIYTFSVTIYIPAGTGTRGINLIINDSLAWTQGVAISTFAPTTDKCIWRASATITFNTSASATIHVGLYNYRPSTTLKLNEGVYFGAQTIYIIDSQLEECPFPRPWIPSNTTKLPCSLKYKAKPSDEGTIEFWFKTLQDMKTITDGATGNSSGASPFGSFLNWRATADTWGFLLRKSAAGPLIDQDGQIGVADAFYSQGAGHGHTNCSIAATTDIQPLWKGVQKLTATATGTATKTIGEVPAEKGWRAGDYVNTFAPVWIPAGITPGNIAITTDWWNGAAWSTTGEGSGFLLGTINSGWQLLMNQILIDASATIIRTRIVWSSAVNGQCIYLGGVATRVANMQIKNAAGGQQYIVYPITETTEHPWNHIKACWDSAGTEFYVNGELVKNAHLAGYTTGITLTGQTNIDTLEIGTRPTQKEVDCFIADMLFKTVKDNSLNHYLKGQPYYDPNEIVGAEQSVRISSKGIRMHNNDLTVTDQYGRYIEISNVKGLYAEDANGWPIHDLYNGQMPMTVENGYQILSYFGHCYKFVMPLGALFTVYSPTFTVTNASPTATYCASQLIILPDLYQNNNIKAVELKGTFYFYGSNLELYSLSARLGWQHPKDLGPVSAWGDDFVSHEKIENPGTIITSWVPRAYGTGVAIVDRSSGTAKINVRYDVTVTKYLPAITVNNLSFICNYAAIGFYV